MSRHPTAISATRLLVGEGYTDQAVFHQVIKQNAIPDFQAMAATGSTSIGEYLVSLETASGFASVTLIVVVGDYDETASFGVMAKQVANAGYIKPSRDRELVKTANKPSIAILMVPSAPSGCIESLCYDAARERWPELEIPLQQYIDQTPAKNWQPSKRAVAQVECTLSVICETHPERSLKDHWQNPPNNVLPVGGPAFADIVQYLRSL
jgi:hypothetical protein